MHGCCKETLGVSLKKDRMLLLCLCNVIIGNFCFYANCCFLGVFRKYDGFVYPMPKLMSLARYFPTALAMDHRRAFFKRFFPKWSGFCVNLCDEKLQMAEALQDLDYLVNGMTVFWTSTSGGPFPNPVDKNALKLERVSIEYE